MYIYDVRAYGNVWSFTIKNKNWYKNAYAASNDNIRSREELFVYCICMIRGSDSQILLMKVSRQISDRGSSCNFTLPGGLRGFVVYWALALGYALVFAEVLSMLVILGLESEFGSKAGLRLIRLSPAANSSSWKGTLSQPSSGIYTKFWNLCLSWQRQRL